MRDMNGDKIVAGDKVVYEWHGGGSGLQQARVLTVRDNSITVKRLSDGFLHEIGVAVTLKRPEGVLRIA